MTMHLTRHGRKKLAALAREPQFGDAYRVSWKDDPSRDDGRRWMYLGTHNVRVAGVYPTTMLAMLSITRSPTISHWGDLTGFERVEE